MHDETTPDDLTPNEGDEAEPNPAPTEPDEHREHVDDETDEARERVVERDEAEAERAPDE